MYSLKNPPKLIKDLPDPAKKVWIEEANAQLKDGKSETSAVFNAWKKVKAQFQKGKDGKWTKKDCLEKTTFYKVNKGAKRVGEDEHFVEFDVTLTKNGVMNYGYKPPEEISRIPELVPDQYKDAGIPAVNDHPEGGVEIKDEKLIVGFYSDLKEENGGKHNRIKAIDHVPKSSPEIIEAVESGEIDGLSIGYRYQGEEEEGEWQGFMYNEVEHRIRIFHVARMLKQNPACPPPDCGYNEDEAKSFEYQEGTNPFPNEHSARITDPKQYDEWARTKDKFGPGIHAVYGLTKTDGKKKSELQSIRFNKDKFTVAEAKSWLKEHDQKYIDFEPAKDKSNEKKGDKKMSKENENNDSGNQGVEDLSIDAIASKNKQVAILLEEHNKLKTEHEETKGENTVLKVAKDELDKAKAQQKEIAIEELKKNAGDRLEEEDIKKMSYEEIIRMNKIFVDAEGEDGSSVKPINIGGSGTPPKNDDEAYEEMFKARSNSIDVKDPETGLYTRPGVDDKTK